jgi:hypothetical protein
MAEHADQTRASSQLPGLLLPGLVPPLLAILAYAILRESYTWFYGRYGVVPEDVGISQIRMLTGVLRIFHLWSLPIPGRPAASFLIVLIGIWATSRLVVGYWDDCERGGPAPRSPLRCGIRSCSGSVA